MHRIRIRWGWVLALGLVGCGAEPDRTVESALVNPAAVNSVSANSDSTDPVSTERVTGSPSWAEPPVVVAVDPPNGASDLPPGPTTLSVTFDREMDPQGWAWVSESPDSALELGPSSFDPSARTNRVTADLEAGRTYVIWINSAQFQYFRDLSGTPAMPYRWTFSTRADGDFSTTTFSTISSHTTGPPRVVRLEPPNHASDVDPATTELRVTFDRPMREGWSWVTEEGQIFPETTGRAFFLQDQTNHVLPVRLAAETTYVVWLNGGQFRDFADPSGVELEPVRWTFSTR